MSEKFTFGSASSDAYGLRIATAPTDDCGAPAGENVEVPGKTGALAYFTGAYGNTQRTYQVSFPCDSQATMRQNIRDIRQWLMKDHSYQTLTDTFDTAIYRRARCVSAIEFATLLDQAAQANITFDCDPRKFLLTGAAWQTMTNGGVLANNYMPSKPQIKVTINGTGTLAIGSYTVRFTTSTTDVVIIDCETMTIYDEDMTASYASRVGLMTSFPELQNGNNSISWTGSITDVKIKPNWWQL